MEYLQRIAGYVTNARGKLQRTEVFFAIDSEALTLSGHDLSGAFAERAESFTALETAYRKRAKAVFESDVFRDPTCVEGGLIDDLSGHFEEMRACGFDRVVAPFDPDDPLEVQVAALCTELQRELNRALGPEPITVDDILLCTDDGRIHFAYVNTPAFAGLGEAEIDGRANGDWEDGRAPNHRRIPLAISHEDLVLAPERWLESNLSYEFLSAFLDLVDVRLEAQHGFRANVTVGPSLRFMHTIHEDVWFSREDRQLAREYVGKPAHAYFAQRYAKLSRA